jgi:hypothetical protein
MAYSDPQSVTIGTTPGAVSLARVNSGSETGSFRNYDQKTELKVGTTYGRRTRHTARVDFSKVVTDPLIATTNVLASGSVYLVGDFPASGFSAAEKKDLAKALLTWLTASTDAALIKLLAGEN